MLKEWKNKKQPGKLQKNVINAFFLRFKLKI